MNGRYGEMRPLIKRVSNRHGLEPELVGAVVITESAVQPFAARYEDSYRWLYRPEEVKPGTCSLETEMVLQKTSFGLMQIMGAVARERGFRGWLTELCRAEVGLEFGCRQLAFLVKRYSDLKDAISAYNQGSSRRLSDGSYVNQRYVDLVFSRRKRLIESGRGESEN